MFSYDIESYNYKMYSKKVESWFNSFTKKELSMIEECEKSTTVRKADIKKQLSKIEAWMKNYLLPLSILEGSRVVISEYTENDFPKKYLNRGKPISTVITYEIRKDKPRIVEAERTFSYHYMEWNLTETAKMELLKKAIIQ